MPPYSGTKCLTPNCTRTSNPIMRGLCAICHKSAKALVENRDTTWLDLERMGLAKANQSENLFMREFTKRRNDIHDVQDNRPG